MYFSCWVFVAVAGIAAAADNVTSSKPSGYVPGHMRVDCHPEPNAGVSDCVERGCLWDYPPGSHAPNNPACYYPSNHNSYFVLGSVEDSPIRLVPNGKISPYGPDAPMVIVATAHANPHTLVVQIAAPEKQESALHTHLNLPSVEELQAHPSQQDFAASSDIGFAAVQEDDFSPFSFKVYRKSTGRPLWDTSVAGSLQYTEQYIQIAAFLPTGMVYGFGEHNHASFMRNLSAYSRWPMWARDQAPSVDHETQNLYGVHNFYMALEGDGNAHGVWFDNTFAQEVEFGPAPHLIYRAIGGFLNFQFFEGPNPADVIQQYHRFIDALPAMPPYWGLGFQLCRYGYKDIEEVAAVVQRMKDAGIPQDVQWIDIDYMDKHRDFSYDHEAFHGLPSFVDYLHSQRMKFTLITDPAISVDYEPFCDADPAAFISWPYDIEVPSTNEKYNCTNNTNVMLGHVWPNKPVGFPDFLSSLGVNYWIEQIMQFHDMIDFDGIWIDMNEPSNFNTNKMNLLGQPFRNLECDVNSTLESPPYKTWGVYQYEDAYHKQPLQMSDKTLCMDGVNGIYSHYEVHNLYGWSESVATRMAMQHTTMKRSPVITRSTFATSGAYAGHWLGDNSADWAAMRSSIVGVLDMNMFGIPYVGADICGFLGDTTEELCLRWQQLGAFYTFSRNHNDIHAKAQDPTQWKSVAQATKQSNLFRYWHLPYIYGVHMYAHLYGGMVTFPLFFLYPNDVNTYTIDRQFMIGDALMIIPALDKGSTSTRGYVPFGSWYDISGTFGTLMARDTAIEYSGWQDFEAPWSNTATVLIRGGSVILRQKPELTTDNARLNTVELAVAADWKRPVPRVETDPSAAIQTAANFSRSLAARKSSIGPNNDTIVAWAYGVGYWDDGDSLIIDMSLHEYWSIATAFAQFDFGGVVYFNFTHTSTVVDLPWLSSITVYGSYMTPDWTSFMIDGTDKLYPDLFKSGYDANSGKMHVVFNPPLVVSPFSKTSMLTWMKA